MSKKLNIAILGTGASALFAAKAAKDLGHEPLVIGVKGFNFPPGPFWFHWVPEDIKQKVKEYKITLIPEGTEHDYQSLQWGRKPRGVSSSFPKKIMEVIGYNPSEVEKVLCPTLFVQKMPKPLSEEEIRGLCYNYDFVFQTFPTELSKDVQKPYQPYYMGALYGFDPNSDFENFVVYNGTGDGIYVRKVLLWGNFFFEFPKNLALDEIKKVMDRIHPEMQYYKLYDMNPWTLPLELPITSPPNLHLVGRWAEWNTKRLSHEAYNIVKEIINGHS